MAIIDSIQEAKRRGASDDQIITEIEKQNPQKAAVFQIARNRGANSTVILNEILRQNGGGNISQINQEENSPGLVQSMAQGIASPILKTAATVKGFTDSVAAGINYLSGNKEAAKIGLDEASKGINAGYFGKAKPIESTKEAIGTGIELGSLFVGGGAAKNVAGAGLKGQMLRGIGSGTTGGALSGALGAGGKSLQENKSLFTAAADSVVGGIVGTVLGGVMGGVAPLAGRVIRKTAGLKSGVQDVALNQSIANSARRIEGTGVNTGFWKTGNRIAGKIADVNEKSVALAKSPVPVQKAAAANIDDAWLEMVKNATPDDRKAMYRMLQVAENNQGKMVTERPVAVAGKSVIDRVDFLKGKRTAIGKRIGEIKKNLPDNQIDITGTVDDFSAKLGNMGISLGNNGKLDFTNSVLNTPYGSEEKKLIEFIWDQIKPDDTGVAFKTPKNLDLIRGRIQNALSVKPKNIGETTYAETLAQGLRRTLKSDIQNVSASYSKLSNQYAEITRVLQDFYGLIGKQWNGKGGDITGLRAGEVMSRILGNASAKPQYILEQVENLAQKLGREKTDDPLYQIAFSDLLEDVFGQTQTRSLGGQVERATMNAQEKINFAQGLGNPLGTAGKVIDKFTAGQKEKQRALKNLLEYYLKK